MRTRRPEGAAFVRCLYAKPPGPRTKRVSQLKLLFLPAPVRYPLLLGIPIPENKKVTKNDATKKVGANDHSERDFEYGSLVKDMHF